MDPKEKEIYDAIHVCWCSISKGNDIDKSFNKLREETARIFEGEVIPETETIDRGESFQTALIANGNKRIIAAFLPDVQFSESTPNTCTFRVKSDIFEKLLQNVR